MKKFFTLIAAAMMVVGVYAQSTIVLHHPTADKLNVLKDAALLGEGADGWTVQCMNETKNLEKSAFTFTINGAEYNAIKLSNGAQTKITLPEGLVATKLTIYSTGNKALTKENYWQEVNGNTFEKTQYPITSGADGTNPTVTTFDIDRTNVITCTQKGEQQCVVFVVEYTTATGIDGITSNETVNENAPVYNLAGQRVSKDAKGILIQNGKKFINNNK